MKRTLLVTLLVLGAAACGDDGDTAATGSTRTVEVDMVDTAFDPDSIEVAEGETIRFVFTNAGEFPHDAFVGDADAQRDHEADMGDAGDAHGGHGDESEDSITVDPGDTGELTYTFDESGTFEIGCHQPGHYDAGMTIDVEVR